MDLLREHKISISWNNQGKFTAEIINGNITQLHFCEYGKDQNTAPCQCLTSTDWQFLNDVYSALGELFATVKEQQKELGYSYADEKTEIKTEIQTT